MGVLCTAVGRQEVAGRDGAVGARAVCVVGVQRAAAFRGAHGPLLR